MDLLSVHAIIVREIVKKSELGESTSVHRVHALGDRELRSLPFNESLVCRQSLNKGSGAINMVVDMIPAEAELELSPEASRLIRRPLAEGWKCAEQSGLNPCHA